MHSNAIFTSWDNQDDIYASRYVAEPARHGGWHGYYEHIDLGNLDQKMMFLPSQKHAFIKLLEIETRSKSFETFLAHQINALDLTASPFLKTNSLDTLFAIWPDYQQSLEQHVRNQHNKDNIFATIANMKKHHVIMRFSTLSHRKKQDIMALSHP
jgi:hypothetical protein